MLLERGRGKGQRNDTPELINNFPLMKEKSNFPQQQRISVYKETLF